MRPIFPLAICLGLLGLVLAGWALIIIAAAALFGVNLG